MKEASASNRASKEDAIDSKWLKCLYVIVLIMLLYLAFRFVQSKGKSACGEERGPAEFPLNLCTGLFDGTAARKDKVSVIVTHCYDSGTSGTSSRTADKSLKFVTKNTHKISHLAVNDLVSDSWLSFTKGQSFSFSSVMFANVAQRCATFTGATSLRGL